MLLSSRASTNPWSSKTAPRLQTTPTTQNTTQEDEAQASIKQLQAQIATLEKRCKEVRVLDQESIPCCGFKVVEKSEQSRLATYGLMILLFATLIWTSREAIVETLNYAMKDYHDGLRIGLLWLIVAIVLLVVFSCVLYLPSWATTGSATGGVQNGVQNAAFMTEDRGNSADDNDSDFLALEHPSTHTVSYGNKEETTPLLFKKRSPEGRVKELTRMLDLLQSKIKKRGNPGEVRLAI